MATVGNAGMYRLRPRCYLSDQSGALGDELTDLMADGEVNVDADAEVPSTFSCRLRDPAAVPAWAWLRPFLRISWYDPTLGLQAVDEPVGHYQVMPPRESHSAAMGIAALDGRDGCWLLKQSSVASGITYAQGANVVEAVRSLLAGAGFARVHIPGKSNTFRAKRHFEAGTPRLDVVNELLHAVGYYPLWFDRSGVAMSRRIQPRYKVEPRRTIASGDGDVVRLVELETDPSRLCNRVTVTADDPKREAPIVVVKSNTRADSPASIANLGFVVAKTIQASNVDTASEATDIANEALEDGASVERRMSLATGPDPAYGFHETIRLAVERDDGTAVVDGLWFWTNLKLGLMPSQQPMAWVLNKVVPYSEE